MRGTQRSSVAQATFPSFPSRLRLMALRCAASPPPSACGRQAVFHADSGRQEQRRGVLHRYGRPFRLLRDPHRGRGRHRRRQDRPADRLLGRPTLRAWPPRIRRRECRPKPDGHRGCRWNRRPRDEAGRQRSHPGVEGRRCPTPYGRAPSSPACTNRKVVFRRTSQGGVISGHRLTHWRVGGLSGAASRRRGRG